MFVFERFVTVAAFDETDTVRPKEFVEEKSDAYSHVEKQMEQFEKTNSNNSILKKAQKQLKNIGLNVNFSPFFLVLLFVCFLCFFCFVFGKMCNVLPTPNS